jgi:hypothetical protein
MRTQPIKLKGVPDVAVQRVVRRLVKDWKAIAKKKDAFAKSAHKEGRDMAAFRAMGIASAFRYCAGRLEYELTPNV